MFLCGHLDVTGSQQQLPNIFFNKATTSDTLWEWRTCLQHQCQGQVQFSGRHFSEKRKVLVDVLANGKMEKSGNVHFLWSFFTINDVALNNRNVSAHRRGDRKSKIKVSALHAPLALGKIFFASSSFQWPSTSPGSDYSSLWSVFILLSLSSLLCISLTKIPMIISGPTPIIQDKLFLSRSLT